MSPRALHPGITLGAYRLEQRLALGGTAELWRAEPVDTAPASSPHPVPSSVALKVLHPHFAADEEAHAMFWDEVNLALRLRHENIVTVFAAHTADGHLFQVLELLDGVDLRKVLSVLAREGRRFPVPLALRIGRDVARALGYAHLRRDEAGQPLAIVHRDVSPHNVMVTRDGVVKLLDFGIARARERLTRTRTGVIKGKVAYMAPEQALALPVTAATDIFAAGIVLWEMLAMERLFRAASDAETLERVTRAEVPDILARCPELPADAARLLAQMLAARPAERPASMRAVEQGLDRILARAFSPEASSSAAMMAWLAPMLEERSARATRANPPLTDQGTTQELTVTSADPSAPRGLPS
jgi:serine/threonine protein kinase